MQRLVKNRGTCIADDSIISRDRKLATQHGTVMLDPETFLTAMEDKLQRLDLLKGRLRWTSRVPGGDINDAIRVADDERDYFIKINRAELSPMFEAEAEALQLIARTATLTCPVPIAWGRLDRTAYLVLEYLQLSARGNDAALGEGLAAMHHPVPHPLNRSLMGIESWPQPLLQLRLDGSTGRQVAALAPDSPAACGDQGGLEAGAAEVDHQGEVVAHWGIHGAACSCSAGVAGDVDLEGIHLPDLIAILPD